MPIRSSSLKLFSPALETLDPVVLVGAFCHYDCDFFVQLFDVVIDRFALFAHQLAKDDEHRPERAINEV